MIVLGIETSCDETAASLVEKTGGKKAVIRSNIVYSQTDEHSAYGGVVPEIAARAHLSRLDGIIKTALDEADCRFDDLDAIGVTAGPGLIGGLLTGIMTAKALAAAKNIPLFAINHLEGHALTPRLTDNIEFPYLLLLVSGGHTQILEIAGIGQYQRIATTIDDALGEAFDKTAKLLGLSYPGGPAVEKAAQNGDQSRFDFPRPMTKPAANADQFHFSFAGLKTAVRQAALKLENPDERDIADICASFQQAVCDVLVDRIKKAMTGFQTRHKNTKQKILVIAGGVAANQKIRAALNDIAGQSGWHLIAPPARLCTDNAAMIAFATIEQFGLRQNDGFDGDGLDFGPRSRWPLDENAPPLIGSGKRGAKV